MATAAGSATRHERYIDHNAEETILYMLKDCDLLEFKKFGVSILKSLQPANTMQPKSIFEWNMTI